MKLFLVALLAVAATMAPLASAAVANACTSVPTISGASPSTNLQPGDVVTIQGSFNSNATCLWWWNENAFILYDPAVSVSATQVVCTVPDRAITFGPDSGSTIGCEDVRVTIQSWDSGNDKQANECFTHEGQSWPQWDTQDYATLQYECTECLDGPFGIGMDANGDFLIANEGAGGGGGTTIALVAGPSHTNKGDILNAALYSGYNGPSGITTDNNGNLIITDDQSGGAIWMIDPSGVQSAFVTGTQPGNNPNAVRVDSSGDVYTANAADGTISKWSSSGGFQCHLAQGVSTPQAVEIDDFTAGGVVYFTDSSATLYTVPMACPSTTPTCSGSGSCSAVTVGQNVYGTGAGTVTEGGLLKMGSKFYISAYNYDAVLEYDSTTSTSKSCYNATGLTQPRGLFTHASSNQIFITSYNTGHMYVASDTACGTATRYTKCDGSGSGSGNGNNNNSDCIPESEDIFYYLGDVVTSRCSGTDCDNVHLEHNGVKYYKMGSASELHMSKCD